MVPMYGRLVGSLLCHGNAQDFIQAFADIVERCILDPRSRSVTQSLPSRSTAGVSVGRKPNLIGGNLIWMQNGHKRVFFSLRYRSTHRLESESKTVHSLHSSGHLRCQVSSPGQFFGLFLVGNKSFFLVDTKLEIKTKEWPCTRSVVGV